MKIITKIGFLFFLLLSGVSKLFACAQVPDRIIFNDTLYALHSRDIHEARDYPFFPIKMEFFRDSTRRHKMDSLFRGASRSALRGYVAHWEIRNDSLFLRHLTRGPIHPPDKIVLPTIFGYHAKKIDLDYLFEDRNTKNGVFADWFRFGSLSLIPFGLPPWYGIESVKYVLRVHNGIVVRKHRCGNVPTDANGRQAEIINAGRIRPTINQGNSLIWPNNDIKSKAGRNEWERFGFEPKTGMKGQVISTTKLCSIGRLIYILLIDNKFYVPIDADAVRLL